MLVQIRTGSQWSMSQSILRGRYDTFPTKQIPTRWENKKFYLISALLKAQHNFNQLMEYKKR